MKASFVTFTNDMKNPLMAYSSLTSYLNYKNIDVHIDSRIIFCKRREKQTVHTNITDYTTDYIFGKTVDDIVDLKSIVTLFKNFDLERDLTKNIDIPTYRNEMIKTLQKEAVELFDNDTVFFSVFRYHFLYHLFLAAYIKRINPNIKIVFGGPQIINSKQTINLLNNCPFIDYIVHGDVETGIYDYLTKPINRIHYAKSLELKDLQMPDYTDQPLFLFENQVMITTSRNCFNKCSYCPSVYLPYKKAPLDSVDKWIKYYCNNNKVKSIYFTDAIFNSSAKRFNGIIDILLNRHKGQSFYIWCHSLGLTEDHIRKLSNLNFNHPGDIILAYDSASKTLCERINRPTAENIDELIDLFIFHGLNLSTFFIAGMPIETEDDFMINYNKIKELRLKHQNKLNIAIHSLLFIPGSPFYEHYEDYNINLEYWDNKTANIYPPVKEIVKSIPRYYYGLVTPDELTRRVTMIDKWR